MSDEWSWRFLPLPQEQGLDLCPSARLALWQKNMAFYRRQGLPLHAEPGGDGREKTLFLHPHRVAAWEDLLRLTAVGRGAVLKTPSGEVLACVGDSDSSSNASAIVLVAEEPCLAIRFPWELLVWHDRLLSVQNGCVEGVISPLACVEGVVRLGEGSVILPGTYIEGPVSIGRNCRIGPHAYLRGGVTIGDDCVAGHAVELKACLFGKGTHVAHLSYVGNSLLGDDVNVGAGCVLSNYRHDGGEHRMMIGGELVATGRRKLGCVVGDHARLGAHTTVLPGRVLKEGATTFPGEVVR